MEKVVEDVIQSEIQTTDSTEVQPLQEMSVVTESSTIQDIPMTHVQVPRWPIYMT